MPDSQTKNGSTDFRLDINGLRAWAVVAVVLYHFGLPWVSGGFVGVDVFFVISGFLMTGIIVSALQRGSFSLWGFYLARARRIMPALIVLCAAVLLLGWFILMPKEYQPLGRHVRESLLFVSNLTYLGEAGYFDSASHEKWLLHTWSLSVEWQFYLMQPIVLLAIWRFFPSRRAVSNLLLSLALLSLGWSIWLTVENPNQAFYLLQSRAWELLLGAMVYLHGDRLRPGAAWRPWLERAGLAMIVMAVLLFDRATHWPGWRALLPVMGAALVLLAAQSASAWTGNGMAQWLGTRSYSIYLWHWPLVVGLVYLERLADPVWVLAGVLLTLLLGHISYVQVEVPARRHLQRVSLRQATVVLVSLTLLVATAAQLVRRSGFPERLPAAVAQVDKERANRNPLRKKCLQEDAACVYGGREVSAILLGDSHADAVVTALVASQPDASLQGILFKGVSGCAVLFGAQDVGTEDSACERFNVRMAEQIDTLHPGKPVVIMSRLSATVFGLLPHEGKGHPGKPAVYFSQPFELPERQFLDEFRQHYLDTACRIARKHPLYLVRPIPEMNVRVPTAMGRALMLGEQRTISISREQYQQRHAFIWSLQDEASERCGARLLDPLPYLCDEQRCYGSKNGMPLYADGDHLSEYGNRLLVPMFAGIFREQPVLGD